MDSQLNAYANPIFGYSIWWKNKQLTINGRRNNKDG